MIALLDALDEALAAAVVRARAVHGDTAGDPFRGLHISPEDVERLLGRPCATPVLSVPIDALAPAMAAEPSWTWLVKTFDLTRFQAAVVLIALAPDVDLRYERLYAYLQDDVTRRRPSIDLVLNLLCHTREHRAVHRAEFNPGARLLAERLVCLEAGASPLSHALRVDEQIARTLLGEGGLDSRLAPFCRLWRPGTVGAAVPMPEETRHRLAAVARDAHARGGSLRLYLQGATGSGQQHAAEYVAAQVDAPLLAVDLAQADRRGLDVAALLPVVVREADLQGAVLFIAGLDDWLGAERLGQRQAAAGEAVATSAGITLLAGSGPWVAGGGRPTGVITVSMSPLPHAVRAACWRRELELGGLAPTEAEVDELAARLRLTPGRIREATAQALTAARWRRALEPGADSPPALTLADLFVAARAQGGHELATLARKVQPRARWSDIVLPPDTAAQLQEICARVAHRHRVLDTWGFGERLSLGKGVHALFAGPSGTGKTMAAEIIASELSLDLYQIDLAGVVSKYIGETEKNLDRIFAAAEDANAVLLFDEADAIFGKRSEVRDSHDRYANLEISYLLQKMEEYEGLAILSTNLRQNLDDAFLRRLAFTVHFPFPEVADRERIWRGIWPARLPLADDVDLAGLARDFLLTGGNIKNVALAAAFYAAADGGRVTADHVSHAMAREFQKMGKVLTADELPAPRSRDGVDA